MRKTSTITIKDTGRDKGKVFIIEELSAADAEEWALEAIFALLNAGVEVPDDVAEMGLAGIASIGLGALGKIPFEKAKPLLDRMMDCVKIIPDAKSPNVVRNLIESDIEEPMTRMKLRKEVFTLHTDFLRAASK